MSADAHAPAEPLLAPGPERRTFWACFAGCALDNMNAQLFSLLIPSLIAAWGMSRGQAGLIASSTLLAGAVGGLVAGYLADRFGRVRVLQATILWFSVFTFLCGLAETPGQLLLYRSLPGLGFGGELAVGAALISELVRPQRRGLVMGWVASGYAVGAVLAGLLVAACFALLPPSLASRGVFWAGMLPALLVLYVRRNVPEPKLRTGPAGVEKPRLSRLFGRELAGTTLLATVLVVGATAGINAFFTWMPTLLQQRGLSATGSGLSYAVATSGSVVGYLLGAPALDRLGRRAVFLLGSIATTAAVLFYLLAPLSPPALLAMGFVSGATLVWTNVGMSPLLSELYPTAVRATGIGFAYSVGRGLGALAPGLIGLLGARMSLATAVCSFVACGYLLVCLCVMRLPETRGAVLRAEPAHD